VTDLRSTERWLDYLKAQARFHAYSPRNVMLIAMQRPDASQVAGFRTWQRFGRSVDRGERAVSILAPIIVREPELDSRRVTGFRWVSVFDVTQTSGAPLPSPVTILDGSTPDSFEESLAAAASSLGFRLRYEELPSGVNGECRWATRTLAIEPRNPAAQRVKTIVHELAHGILHEDQRNRCLAEIEAESVAFVVLAALGMDSTPYSAGYVASWIGNDRDPAEAINGSCIAIQRASSSILGLLGIHQRAADRPTHELAGLRPARQPTDRR
jgi:hypothetical protein